MDRKLCIGCGADQPLTEYKTPTFMGPAKCNSCRAETKRKEKARYKAKHPENVMRSNRKSVSAWGQRYPEKVREKRARRRLSVKDAMPSWADKSAIQAVYAEAVRLTKQTGISHEVDHIVPVNGKNVCGLHVHWNLEAIPATDNHAKGNRVDDEWSAFL